MDTNYFVCTLGEAAQFGDGRGIRDVSHLIIEQLQNRPDLPALGLYKVGTSERETIFEPDVLTFKDVHQGVLVAAEILSSSLEVGKGDTVALLSSSSPEFLFTWLACIWLGHPVLLIAPECSALAIAELCQSCRATVVIADDKHEQLGTEAAKRHNGKSSSRLRCLKQPFDGYDVFEKIRAEPQCPPPAHSPEKTDTAYFNHTSGTSSGTPKPISQSHQGAVGALPALEGRDQATFTTTPLYHGGPADIFRAWTSNAMVWLFPSKDSPVTAGNIVKCLKPAKDAAEKRLCPPVKFFASVPYVLQTMAADEEACHFLRNMELISVGGAALPQEVGDELVEKGVNLVSRFGSAECGFLMSSHRDYNNDKEWQYLRSPDGVPKLRFEVREDGLSELVVPADWPHMAMRNRDDGSYASSDLFESHPHIRDAWKYHSRADAQLTLLTGKKFDPGPLEMALVAKTPLVSDALVFGTGRAYPGILLFRSKVAANLTDDDVIQKVAPCVEQLNAESQSHARIHRSMLVPMPYFESPLEKSSKGTVIRNKANARYVSEIDGSYQTQDFANTEQFSDGDIPQAIKDIVLQSTGDRSDLTDLTDLFAFGVDSMASIRIRHGLQQLLPNAALRLPMDVVEECGSVSKLVEYILSLRHGGAIRAGLQKDDDRSYMKQLVEQYSNFNGLPTEIVVRNDFASPPDGKEVVVLTGATGALGTHVLDQLRNSGAVSEIYCLVRGADVPSATERINKALQQRKLSGLDFSTSDKVVVLKAKLGDKKLGLDDETYSRIADEATIIMHLAWSVNFRMKLRSFVKDSIASVRNLIDLALASPRGTCPKFAFCSSVAAVMAHSCNPMPEAIIDDPDSATDIGYSQSKWVAEHICDRASKHTRLRGRMPIFRLGQLSGDRATGVWNKREAWPLLLSTVKVTGSLPALQNETIDWLPVDVAAAAMIEGTMSIPPGEGTRLFHIVNDNRYPAWSDLLCWLSKRISFEIVSPAEWVRRLDDLAQGDCHHPALELLEHWRHAFVDRRDPGEKQHSRTTFGMVSTKDAIKVLRNLDPIDECYFNKLWSWIEASMLGIQKRTYAYSTLLTRASYLAGVIILAYTLRKQGSQYPLIVFYTSGLSEAALQVLKKEAKSLSLILKLCDPLLPPEHIKVNLIAQRFADTWTKLRVFEVFHYDAVCYLDADMAIFNGNMDDIFSYIEDLSPDHIAANHVCCCNLDSDPWAPGDWRKENCAYTPLSHPTALQSPTAVRADSRPTHQLLNGGMFLYRPNKELWSRMLIHFNTSDTLGDYMFPDQDFLADFFRGRWQSIGWQWNALKTMRYWHSDMWRDSEVRCLHYIVDKPWAARIPTEGHSRGVAGYKGRDGETHQWWWDEYNAWASLRHSGGSDEVLRVVEEYIAPGDGTELKDPDMKHIAPPKSS